jgi:SAM-dependent methyltransferase
MRQQLGFADYAGRSVLDFGCGVRFSQTIINARVPIGRYVGVDNYRPMIEFLRDSVWDERLSYVFLDAHHAMYNPDGAALSPDTRLDVPTAAFDVVCMFSVITHQYPDDSTSIFSILRRHVRRDGQLFFTCFLDESIPAFEDRSRERNGGIVFYNPRFIMDLVERCGWQVVSRAPAESPLIGDSFVFRVR